MNIDTTRKANGDMATTTSGVGVSGGSGALGELFKTLIQRKIAAASNEASASRSAPKLGASQPAIAPRMPEMGTGRGSGSGSSSGSEVLATRMRSVPQNPYDAMSRIPGGMGGTGHTNTARLERYIKGVGWEFDGDPAMNPSGPSGGIIGGGGEPSGPTPNLQARMPAYNTGSPSEGTEFGSRAPINPYNRNNDARGEGFGKDYGRGVKGRGARA